MTVEEVLVQGITVLCNSVYVPNFRWQPEK